MKKVVIATFLLILLLCTSTVKSTGGPCIGCMLAQRALYQIIEFQEPNIEKALQKFCNYLPSAFSPACKLFVTIEGPILIKMLEAKENGDVICQNLKLCKDTQCKLYPAAPFAKMYRTTTEMKSDPWWKPILDTLAAPFKELFSQHIPVNDLDKDRFSIMTTFRGSNWRGKDCDDNRRDIYPGRRFNNVTDDPRVDNNCNGIYGVDPNTGRSYEDLFCSGSGQRGIVALGDSATAHFRIPEQLISGPTINAKTYSHLFNLISNEMDFPHLSTYTAYENDTTGLVPGPVSSLYLKMRERNRCMHRDYQNIGVNGARADYSGYLESIMARNQTADHPLLVTIALIGNDVCSGHKGFDRMTTPAEFYAQIVKTLDALDQTVPPESHVLFIGLAQGSMLYDFMEHATHPLGVSYPAFYDWLNCINQTPCWGWMNTNATVRALTTQRAEELSQVYNKIISDKQGTYKNFKMLYHDFPLKQIAEEYVKKWGKEVKDLIEPMDGFHPSQIAQALTADYISSWLEQEHPEVLGSVNPYNDQIEKVFGNQGGYN